MFADAGDHCCDHTPIRPRVLSPDGCELDFWGPAPVRQHDPGVPEEDEGQQSVRPLEAQLCLTAQVYRAALRRLGRCDFQLRT